MGCGRCGRPLPAQKTGRQRQYCDSECARLASRQAARVGRALETLTAAGYAVVKRHVSQEAAR